MCSAAAVILALRRLELSVAYAIWSGVGTALTAMIGIAYFREPFTLVKLASLALVVHRRGRLEPCRQDHRLIGMLVASC